MSRLDRLASRLAETLLVTTPANVRYLTGLESSNAALLVEPDGEATLYTDFRYAETARRLDRVAFVETRRNVLAELAGLLAGRRIAVEAEQLTVAGFDTLVTAGVEPVPTQGVVLAMRAVKDDGELDAIRRAARVSDRVFAELAREQFTGRTERELAWWIERRLREEGATGTSFDVIVAAGAGAASPHSHPGDRIVEPRQLVIVDAGAVVDGYCSDCTRTFATGELSEQLAAAYELCLRAQLDGLAAVCPGAQGRAVDAASRVAIEAAGLGAAYGHGLGHGVGLEIHEAPVLRPESEDVLEQGNVVTVEPGIYLPGVGGVRIEDLVVVTDDGCERLTTFGKELITVE
ncbi:MAG: Xaa-Pro peptidase family protein [Thermoleophilia bacterium]|nr:Xaa-Pro peptidase family protein [Thermoleophilia bacterium]